MNSVDDLIEAIKESGAKVTFSRWCSSGIVERCECFRCRTKRGEEVTVESEAEAERVSREAKAELEERTRMFLKRKGG